MRVSIIQTDNVVVVDGDAQRVDCSSLPTYFHAIQWDGKKGWIEYDEDSKGRRLPNTLIVDISPYQYLIDAWAESKSKADDERAEFIQRVQNEDARLKKLQREQEEMIRQHLEEVQRQQRGGT